MLKNTKCLAIAMVTIMVAMVTIPMVNSVMAAPAGWNEANVLPGADPQTTAVAVDSNNHVHIIYTDANYGYHLVYIDDVSGSWSTPITIGQCNGLGIAIAVDSHNNVDVAYSNDTSLMFATNAGGSWVNSTVNNSGYAGIQLSMAIDHNDHVGIAFSEIESGLVRYATNDGGSWAIGNVTPAGDTETSPSLAFDSANHPYVACYSYGIDTGLVIHANTTGTWTTTVVDASSVLYDTQNIAAYVSLCMDHDNNADIAYMTCNASDYPDTVHFATNAGGTWKNATVGSITFPNNDIVSIPAIVVDSSNNPSICYGNPYDSDLLSYVEVASLSGSSWTITQLGSGYRPGMAIGPNGNLYAAYDGVITGASTWGLIAASTGTIPNGGSSSGGSVPGPVSSAKATAGDNQVTISWSNPTTGGSASTVLIYRSSTNSMPSTPLATISASSVQYVDSTALNNNTYYYWIAASNSNGVGSAVATGSVTPGATSPASSSSSSDSSALLIGAAAVIIVVAAVGAFVFMRKRKMP